MKAVKRLWYLILAVLCLASCGGNVAETTEAVTDPPITEPPVQIAEISNGTAQIGSYYTNKITGSAADPFILEHNGMYYLYSTGGSKFTVRTSKDLTGWKTQDEPIIRLSDLGWAKDKGWAPEMYEYNGKFYFIFSACGHNGLHSIEIAVCDTPNGKFVPITNDGKPFYAPEYSVIDASLFFDDDGRIYMYYSKDNSTNHIDGKRVSQSYGIELTSDLSATIGEPVLISTPEYPWELKSGSVIWNEGPVVFKENGTYYLLYSANYYVSEHYSVGYATSDSPLKKFDKIKDSRILSGNGKTVTGPGHCNILRSPDGSEIYVVYHVHTVPPNTDGGRSLAIDRLIINEDGTLSVDGPSEVRRPLPSGINGYYHINEGFTYEVTGERSEIASASNPQYLFDGRANTRFTDILSLENGGNITVSFEESQKIAFVWIYPASYEDYIPATADLLINGQYLIKGLIFRGNIGNPLVVNFTNLPDGALVDDISITVYTAEGKQYAGISELTMITKQ